MFRKLLLAKLHGLTVTAADLNYEGSLTLPPELLAASGIVPYEALHVWNVTRGTRIETYAIEGQPGSTDVCANGAAAHLIFPGDRIIVASFAFLSSEEIADYQPKLVFVDADNRLSHLGPEIAGPRRREHEPWAGTKTNARVVEMASTEMASTKMANTEAEH